MTPTNDEREALLNKFREIIAEQGWQCRGMTEKLIDAAYAHIQSPISQNDQQGAVAIYQSESRDGAWWDVELTEYEELKKDKFSTRIIYTSPTKQIPDEWKPIETVPKDGTQVIIKCSGGRVATAFYDDKQFFGEGWHVVVPFLGGVGSGTDTFIYFQEDMPTHWMPLPAPTLKEKG